MRVGRRERAGQMECAGEKRDGVAGARKVSVMGERQSPKTGRVEKKVD